MDIPKQDITVRPEEISRRTGVAPSEALNRFEPPEAFVHSTVETSETSLRYGFQVADLKLLIRAGVGSEVVPMMPLASIPHGPAWLLGVINLRGNLVPVCDMRRVLGRNTGGTAAKQMILVLDKGENAAGFIIDGHPYALSTLHPANQLPNLPEPLPRYINEAYSDGEEIWLEFDHGGFLEGSNQ